MNGETNIRADTRADTRTNLCTDKRTNICTDKRTDTRADNCTNIRTDKRTDIRTDKRTAIRADTRTNLRTDLPTYACTDIHRNVPSTVRIGKILCRARQIQRVNESHLAFGLSFACFMLGVGLVGSVSLTADGMPPGGGSIVTGGYGTVMLHSSASIFVLVALLAFVAGVAMTAICVRRQHKKTYKIKQKIKEKNK